MLNDELKILKERALSCKLKGTFLLSTAQMSDYWIDINEFGTPEVITSLINVSTTFLKGIYKKYGNFSLVIPKYNNSSEKSFPIDYILECAIEKTKLKDHIHKVYIYQVNENHVFKVDGDVINFCVVAMAVSIHIVTLLDIIKTLTQEKYKVKFVYTFLCRELFSVKKLKEQNIPIIPLLITELSEDNIYAINDFFSSSADDKFSNLNLKSYINFFKEDHYA